MRAVMLALATVVAVPMFGIDRLVPTPLQAAEQVAEIVAKAREALGGEPRLAAVTALAAEGPFRRTMGPREMEGTITLTLGVPDRKIRHEEDLALPGGAGVTRLAGMNGDHVWEDNANRGGMGGGQIMIRMAGPGGGDREPDPEMMRQMQQRRLTAMYERMTLALLASASDLTHAGVAEVGGGKADVLEKQDAAGRPVRLFISQETHLPIAISYMEVRPRMMIQGGPGGPGGSGGPGARGPRGQGGQAGPPPDPEAMRERMQAEGPPPPSTVIMRLEDHRSVNGLQLPHLIVQTVDGKPTEEWTISKYQVNPRLKADLFDKK